MNVKRSLLVGATVATVAAGVGGVGLVSADTSTSNSSGTSIVDKIATKFNLNKADVQAVFDADRQEHDAQMETTIKQKLATAVSDGKLTQAQADHITSVMNEIKTLRGSAAPHEESDSVREQIKTKLDDLRTWAEDNDIDTQYIMFGHGGRGPGMGDGKHDASSSDSSSSSSN